MTADAQGSTASVGKAAVAVLLGAAIFIVDTLTPLDYAIAVLYVLVVLLSADFLEERGIWSVAFICIGLTVVGFLVGHVENFTTGAVVRFAISLCAIMVAAFLELSNKSANGRLASQAALLDLTHDAIFVRDPANIITYWNRGAEQLYGWTAGDAVGRHANDLLKTRFPADLARINACLIESGRWEGEVTQTKRDGSDVTIQSRWSLQRDRHGKARATMETNSDVTQHRAAEQNLRKAQAELAHVTRVTTLGELAASIAHETSQPLAAIVSNGEAGMRWLNREAPNVDAAKASLEKMVGSARRAHEVIARLRALARRSDAELLPISLNEVIEECLALIHREMEDRRIELELSMDPSLPTILGDRVQLQQVIINLVMNAMQAMTRPGAPRLLRITTGAESADADMAVLQVIDTGTGFAPEVADKLFTAFQTTKTDGMGMGLSISRSIVEAHSGQISASPNPRGGAIFVVRLPVDRKRGEA
ncbi:MAG: PAS domain S-box protein [Pseudolabrys sp.]|nr:PAS domain S-box protein [Pseudolabrys sp.]